MLCGTVESVALGLQEKLLLVVLLAFRHGEAAHFRFGPTERHPKALEESRSPHHIRTPLTPT